MQSIYIFRAAARVASHAPREARFGRTMTAIPRYRSHVGPVILSTGFRPFFLGSSIWAAVAIPLWLGAYVEGLAPTIRTVPKKVNLRSRVRTTLCWREPDSNHRSRSCERSLGC